MSAEVLPSIRIKNKPNALGMAAMSRARQDRRERNLGRKPMSDREWWNEQERIGQLLSEYPVQASEVACATGRTITTIVKLAADDDTLGGVAYGRTCFFKSDIYSHPAIRQLMETKPQPFKNALSEVATPPFLAQLQARLVPTLPTESGVYFLCRANEIVYVGQAQNVCDRICTHINEGAKRFDSAFYIPVPPPALNAVEKRLILHLQPEYNQTHREGKRGNPELVIKHIAEYIEGRFI
jgi:hypothetical protein